MRKGIHWRLPILLGFLVVLAAFTVSFRVPALRAAGRLLTIDEVTSRADIIVVPEWAGPAGALEAADLVRSGVSSRVAIIAEPARAPERELARRGIRVDDDVNRLIQVLHESGVTDVMRLADAANGTEAEGRILPAFCREHDVRSIVVVSTSDHSRRIRRVMGREMRAAGAKTEITVKSATYSAFDPDRWWQTRDGTRTEIVEFEKLALDVVRHPFS